MDHSVVALVHYWLDYGNAVLVGLLAHLMPVLNAAARLELSIASGPVTTLLMLTSVCTGCGYGTNSVQAGCLGIQSSLWRCTVLPQSAHPR